MNEAFIRVVVFFVTFILVVILPWWISAFLLVGLTIYFPLYLEVMFFAFLFDTLYSGAYAFPYIGLSLYTIFLLITVIVRTRIRI